jgi:collagenase-like PrtC family protease
MKFFSVPADFKRKSIDQFAHLNQKYQNSRIIETYGQASVGELVSSGRMNEMLPRIDMNDLKEYISYSKKMGIDFNYTLNPACFGNFEFSERGIEKLYNFLQQLHDIGVEGITITTPPLFELLQASGIDFHVKASAICEITSNNKAAFYKKLGAERIVVDPDITRDFNKLKGICDTFGDGVEIIINNVCYKNCAYKMFHYNHEAHCNNQNHSQTIKDYYFNRCSLQKADEIQNVIKLNWIRPEDICLYNEIGINYFKIQGRQNVVNGNISKMLEHYIQEDYSGDLYSLITVFAPYNSFQPYIDNKKLEEFVKKFYYYPGFCKETCSKCNYCKSFAEKALILEQAEEINECSTEYYNKIDGFKNTIQVVNSRNNTKVKREEKLMNIEFNFK